MNSNPNIKKLSIRLRVLHNEVIDFMRGSFFGVRAMDPDVLFLWEEYNDILSELMTDFSLELQGFYELPYPDPEIANDGSFYKEGTMVYKPNHFNKLRDMIEKLSRQMISLKNSNSGSIAI